MAYKFDTNIPIPTAVYRSTYPFGEMEVGYSFLVELKGANDIKRTRNALGRYKQRNRDKDFTTRVTKEGIRVWRTK